MSEQQRRRLRPTPVPRRVGEPNVLSNQAIPNRLSSTGSADSATSAATGAPVANTRAVSTRPTVATGRPAPAPTGGTGSRPRRLPSLSTLIFIGFLILTASRFLNNIGAGEADPTTPPGQSTAAPQPTPPRPTPTARTGPVATQGPVGSVTFGTSLGDECALEGEGETFPHREAVWWRAELEDAQAADADALVFTFHDDTQINREFVPADPAFGEWSVLCAGGPTMGTFDGTYRVEVWTGDGSILLATGAFTRSP